jgi:hypothetical protein
MTDEIMPREDRMGKILSFIGGCIVGVAGVFAVAVMSELSTSKEGEESTSDITSEEVVKTEA